MKEGIIGAGLILLAITHWLPLGIQFLELAGAFAHFTLMISAIIAVLSIYKRLLVLTGLALASVCVSGTLVMGHIGSLTLNGKSEFTIGQFNVYHHNPNFNNALTCLMIQEPDVITIQELNSEWAPAVLRTLKPIYPYFHEEYQDSCCYGIGIYSRYPIAESRSILIEGVFMIEAELELKHGRLTIFSQHTLPPVFPNRTIERNGQLQELSRLIRKTEGPVIALGDFNVVPWDPVMKRFLETSGQTRVHSGFQATYPMDLGVPLIPIDHITFSKHLVPNSCDAFDIPGSDHRGLVASFKFKE